MEDLQSLDPETEFLYSKQQTSNEWELFKENVRPLKRGRNVNLLNEALQSHANPLLKKSLLDNRRKLIEDIDDYKGDDPLQPWLKCIKWVQESFPPGGDGSGLVLIYEQCVRTFWHDDHYKDDLRYLKVWLEYIENCLDAEPIYTFLEANNIGQSHSAFYIWYALHMESKNKVKAANEIFSRGIDRNAQPREKLEAAYKKFIARSMRRPKVADEDSRENPLPSRTFGTVLPGVDNRRQIGGNSNVVKRNLKQDSRECQAPLAIYKDATPNMSLGHKQELPRTNSHPWLNLGTQAERNKENCAVPTKWTSYKVPQRHMPRVGGTTSGGCIQVFIDEECAESLDRTKKMSGDGGKSSSLQLREENGQDIKRETELLRENPLRNFPINSLPR